MDDLLNLTLWVPLLEASIPLHMNIATRTRTEASATMKIRRKKVNRVKLSCSDLPLRPSPSPRWTEDSPHVAAEEVARALATLRHCATGNEPVQQLHVAKTAGTWRWLQDSICTGRGRPGPRKRHWRPFLQRKTNHLFGGLYLTGVSKDA